MKALKERLRLADPGKEAAAPQGAPAGWKIRGALARRRDDDSGSDAATPNLTGLDGARPWAASRFYNDFQSIPRRCGKVLPPGPRHRSAPFKPRDALLVSTGILAWALALPAFAAEEGSETAKVPEVVLDAGSPDWVVEPFIGNGSAGQQSFFDGPALQVGGAGTPSGATRLIETADGSVYFRNRTGIIKVRPDGIARLVLRNTGRIEGAAGEASAGDFAWNEQDQSLYLTGPNCIRRLYTKPDGTRWVEVVAGTPNKPGLEDGPAKAATMNLSPEAIWNYQGICDGFCLSSTGALYFTDGGIRKLEKGVVSTVTRAVKGFMTYNEEEDLFYLPATDKIRGAATFNAKTGEVNRVVGSPPSTGHYEVNHDGPALTQASFNSNFSHCLWDPYHKALWVWGPDEKRFRWLKDGWVRTVITEKQGQLVWINVIGVNSKGHIYISGASNPTGIWRARKTKEVKP